MPSMQTPVWVISALRCIFLVLFDIPPQVQELLQECDVLDLTEHPEFNGTLSEINDGSMHQDLITAIGEAGHRISFSRNMDAVSIFESSHTSTWPIQLFINKYSVANIIWLWRKLELAGPWIGKEKPHMGNL